MRIIDAQTVQVTVEADEPSTPAFDDLSYLSFYYKVGQNGPTVVGAKVPAIKRTGGDHYSTDLIVPAPVNQSTVIDFWVTATDLAGNESPQSQHVPLTVERLAPPVPINFTVA